MTHDGGVEFPLYKPGVIGSSTRCRLRPSPSAHLRNTRPDRGSFEPLSKRYRFVFTRPAPLREVWGYDFYGGTQTVDVHVRRLRARSSAPSTSI